MGRLPPGDTPVFIVGAGPTGLVLALVLTKLGVRVRLIDQTPGPARYSRALGVHARTLEFYRQLGFADAVMEGGVVAKGVSLWVKRARVARLPLANAGDGLTPFPFVLSFAQNDHERLLIEQLERLGVTVQRETRLAHFEMTDGGVRATLARADGAEEVCDALYIAGCDGAHSVVREGLRLGFPGGTYTKLFYVADVTATGPVTDGDFHVDLDTNDLLAVFAMKGKGHVRLVGTIRDDAAPAEQELTFDDVSHHLMTQLGITIESVHWFSTYRVHHRVASRFQSGRAFLLGDSAHIHSPVGAQGMNTGIGDAMNLGWKLASVIQGTAAPALLDTYEPERIRFARRLVATTDRAYVLVSTPSRLAAFARTRIVPIVFPFVLSIPPARRWLFRTISQIAINYRHSRLSHGTAGDVHGGDRLPWVAPEPGSDGKTDNFTPLETMAWQVHVYGEARADFAAACAELGLEVVEIAWRPAMRAAGLARDAAYLVRPDGYVALADAAADAGTLSAFIARAGIEQTRAIAP